MPEGRILVVDDEEDIRIPLRRYLSGKGFEVVEADGTAQALESARKQTLDAAIVDFSLRDGDGLVPAERHRHQGDGGDARFRALHLPGRSTSR